MKLHFSKTIFWLLIPLLVLAGCSQQPVPVASPSPGLVETATSQPSPQPSPTTAAPTDTAAPTPSPTTAPTDTATLAPTDTPEPTLTPTSAFTPTAEVPIVKVQMRAFCRYGPGKAYLYSHELKEGDQAPADGRNYSGTWLWIQPTNLNRHCWMAASVAEVTGDISALPVVQTRLPQSTLYGPPDNVQAVRDGNTVVVTWDPVWMTEDDDRGYLIEASVCQNGARISVAVQTDTPSYEFTDEQSCSGESGGQLYTVEKHGYTSSVPIPWP